MKVVSIATLFSLLGHCLAQGTPPTTTIEVTPVDYSHEGAALQGFVALPPDASESNRLPALVIIPDWDGVNEYEQIRASYVAQDLGYVGFAADIYGAEYGFVEDTELRGQLATLYRSNATLFAHRIQAAVDIVRTLPEVDVENVAIAGYCFGGTGVLTYGLLGVNDVKGIVSFHGGLTSLPPAGPAVAPKMLVLSGGDDDTSTNIMNLETTLDSVNATWEITRYSGIQHAFTVWSDERYNAWADQRSWESMKEFLKEVFGQRSYESSPPASIDNVEAIPYVDVDGALLQGYLARPSGDWMAPHPGVVILPDWDGVNLYEKERAILLADLGYMAFAADIFGADLQEELTIDQRIEQTGLYRGNMTLFVQRINRAIAELKSQDGVDADNVAVIGYCFGGTGIIQLAFSGNSEVKVVVSFHGGLTDLPNATVAISPYTLILSGGDDDAHGNQTELEAALNAASAEWEITRYAGVDHGFTAWQSDAYSVVADVRSWESMLKSMQELMSPPVTTASLPSAAVSLHALLLTTVIMSALSAFLM